MARSGSATVALTQLARGSPPYGSHPAGPYRRQRQRQRRDRDPPESASTARSILFGAASNSGRTLPGVNSRAVVVGAARTQGTRITYPPTSAHRRPLGQKARPQSPRNTGRGRRSCGGRPERNRNERGDERGDEKGRAKGRGRTGGRRGCWESEIPGVEGIHPCSAPIPQVDPPPPMMRWLGTIAI